MFPEIVARVLQIDPSQVWLRAGDPEGPVLSGGGAFASRSMLAVGSASFVAATEVLQKGRDLAAAHFEAAVADIVFADGIFRVAGTDRQVGLLALAHSNPGRLDMTGELVSARAFPSGAHVAEVDIDPQTGVAALVNYVAVDDCGVVLNHTLLEGQIIGGMMQGLGQVFGELCVYDPGSGQLLSASFMDYAMPRAELLSRVEIHDGSVRSPNNPLGVKGAGEAGTTGALPTAMNAVLDALRPAGVAHLDMPASAARIWAALQITKPAA